MSLDNFFKSNNFAEFESLLLERHPKDAIQTLSPHDASLMIKGIETLLKPLYEDGFVERIVPLKTFNLSDEILIKIASDLYGYARYKYSFNAFEKQQFSDSPELIQDLSKIKNNVNEVNYWIKNALDKDNVLVLNAIHLEFEKCLNGYASKSQNERQPFSFLPEMILKNNTLLFQEIQYLSSVDNLENCILKLKCQALPMQYLEKLQQQMPEAFIKLGKKNINTAFLNLSQADTAKKIGPLYQYTGFNPYQLMRVSSLHAVKEKLAPWIDNQAH